MINNKVQRLAQPLFTGHAAGVYTLPDELVQARDNVERLLTDPPSPPTTLEGDLFETAAHATATGAAIDIDAILEHRRTAERHTLTRLVHERAVEIADQHLAALLADTSATIITDHLQPVHDRIVTDARATFTRLAGIGEDAGNDLLLQMNKATREAWLRADDLAQQWAAVRNARATAIRLGHNQTTQDQMGYFAETRNADTVKPWITAMSTQHIQQMEQDTIPTASRARLRWYLEHDAVLWCPTLTEQDTEHDRVFGHRLREQAANRHALEGFRAIAS